jgi:arsenate reductase
VQAHWGIADPAAAQGTPEDIAGAFLHAFHALRERISDLTSLSPDDLEGPHLAERLRAIHGARGAA